MKLETIKNYAEKIGLETKVHKMTNGEDRLYLSFEVTDYTKEGMAWNCRPASQKICDQILKYLERYKINYKYTGSYMGIWILE